MGLPTSAVLFALGAFTLIAQTVLLREHLVACNGGELAIGLFFATWFLWIAAGATLRRWLPVERWDPVRWLLVLVLLYLPAMALQGTALRSLRWLSGVPTSDVFPVGALAWSTLLANAPLGVLTGLAFPAACALVAGAATSSSPASAVTRSYVLEAAGAFAGGLIATAMILGAAAPSTLIATGMLPLAAGAAALALQRRAKLLGALAIVELAVAAAVLATPLGRDLEETAERVRFARALPDLEYLESLDTPHRHLSIGRGDGQVVALSDGSLLAALPDRDGDVPTAALLIAQRPAASRILVVGQGAEGRIAELLAYRPDRLVHLQPDRAAAEALERHLPPALTGVLTDPALDRRFGDPRRELTRIAAGGGRFDLIVLDLGDPTTAAANRLATREFVDLCGDLLADDGALATRIGATVNYQGEEVRRYAASALLTLGQVFDEVAVIPGETSWLIAGAAGIPSADPDELARRYRSLAGPLQAVPAGTFASLVEPRRVAAATASYASAAEEWGEDLLNTDAAPVAYLLQLRVLAHASGSALPAALGAAQRGGAWLVIVPLLVACGVSLRRSLLWPDPEAERRRAGALLVGLAGAAAIALQVCLILSFQVRFGDLFAQVGWLNALFMAGLAAGGLAGGRWLRGSGLTPPIVFCLAGVGLCLMAGSAIPALQTSIAGSAGPLYYALIATGGAVFGAGFPVAGGLVTHRGSSAGAVGATLEAADHWGAALGAALVGVALVPLLGPARTSTLLALALAIAAVTIALPPLLRTHLPPGTAAARLLEWIAGVGRRRPRVGRAASGWLGGLVLATVAVTAIVRISGEGPRIHFPASELAGMTADVTLTERERPFVHYRGQDAAGEPVGDVLCSSLAVTDEIHGYGGPLNLLISLTPDGTVQDLRLVESRETPAYLTGFDDWIRQLRGLPLESPIDAANGLPIEGLTGATVTATAALTTVDRVRREVSGRILSLPLPAEAPQRSPWTRIQVLVLAGLLFASVPVLLSGQRWLRAALLGLSALAAGLWLNQQLSVEHLAPLARLELPSPANSEGWLLLGGAAAMGIAFGPVYCGMLCPFGALQELLSSLGLTTRASPRAERAARAFKYPLLAAVIVLFAVSGAHAWLGFDPLATRLGLRAAGPLLALVLLVLGASLRYRRFWCRTLCPVGAALSLTNRVALLGRWLPPRRHDRCDLGVADPGDWDCIQCNRCTWEQAPRSRPSPEGTRRRRAADRWLAVLLALALALVAGSILSARPLPVPSVSGTRPVDVDRIRTRIESRQLSDHPAEYWDHE